jgi:hypothetical protein
MRQRFADARFVFTLTVAALLLAGSLWPAAPARAQQQDAPDRARQQRTEQMRQQREAEMRERMEERQQARRQEIRAQIRRNAAPAADAVLEQDSLALVALYNSTDGDNWYNNTGWLSAPVADWQGVTVSRDRVVDLDLYANQLTGTIPTELSQLSNLQSLNLYHNQLTGTIPTELSQLSNLQFLSLGVNELTGAVPVAFTNLTAMSEYRYGSFYFDDTDLCEPSNADFQAWLGSIYQVLSTGVVCEASSGPAITGVSPNPVPGSNSDQPFTINGSGFEEGAFVILDDLSDDRGPFDNPEKTTFVSSTELTRQATFTENAATWSARVENPDGTRSGIVQFEVVAPGDGNPPTEPPPLAVEISGDYYGESSFTHDFSSYTRLPRPQDKLVAAVRITNNGSVAAVDVAVEGTFAGGALAFAGYDTAPSDLGDLDADGDGRIDEIAPSESAEFLTLSESFTANQENEALSVSVAEANGSPVSDVSVQRTVSLYFAKGADGGPFTFGEDNYASNNYSIQSTETIKGIAEAAGAPVSIITALAKLHYTQIGLCYGFSSTAGLYFQNPDQRPTANWRNEANTIPLVANNIVDYHFYQITRPTVIGIFFNPLGTVDVSDEYVALKTRFAQSDPSLIALLDETENGHAILATKLTEYQDESKGYIEVYDPNNTDFAALATYDASEVAFSYPFYGSSYPFFSEGPPYSLANPYIFDAFATEPIPPSDLESDFMDPFIAEIADVISSTGQKLFATLITPFEGQSAQTVATSITDDREQGGRSVNLLVTDGEGRQAGHRADGTLVNEIPGADVDRVALDEVTADSLTPSDSLSYVCVPADGAYAVSMTSSETGSVRFDYYQPGEGEAPSVASADGIEFSENTTAIFNESDSSANIYVDRDGDGETDEVVSIQQSALPVEMTSFEAVAAGQTVRLTWQTAGETGNDGFHVERSLSGDGATFEEIGFRKGAGTTTEAQAYRFTDAEVPFEAERLTYRLRQTDRDGDEHVSEAVEVEVGGPSAFALHGAFPNPSQGRATIRYALPEAAVVELSVYDALGRKVRTLVDGAEQQGRQKVRFDAAGLASGTYFVRLRAGGHVETETLVLVR